MANNIAFQKDGNSGSICLLKLRQENLEEKYRGIDDKMTEEINKITTGERRNTLLKLLNEDCQRNEAISKKRWENKNVAWFAKYEETFKKTYEQKNPVIKVGKNNDSPRSYADVASTAQNR